MTAVASYADARAHQGKWLVRIEDPPTRNAHAAADILRTLAAFGFEWTAKSLIKAADMTYIKTPSTAQSSRAGVSLLLQPQRLAGGGNTWRRRICI